MKINGDHTEFTINVRMKTRWVPQFEWSNDLPEPTIPVKEKHGDTLFDAE